MSDLRLEREKFDALEDELLLGLAFLQNFEFEIKGKISKIIYFSRKIGKNPTFPFHFILLQELFRFFHLQPCFLDQFFIAFEFTDFPNFDEILRPEARIGPVKSGVGDLKIQNFPENAIRN